ncbi:oligosaccharide flippase family protein [Flagellimonas algicola]|uniref:Flippase n=1 Tax=Flagellimonas algicola TaxID=2583815 RepID=A0ABY2WK94_9FLAO|nr:oligosaccharide flippase family protein [Allomuricauda algicola]TMU55052.1 flippase [Allomuricauda algicola]
MNNKGLFKNISLFTFFNLLNSGIPFLLLPFLTVYLSPEDYGLVDIFYNIYLVAMPVIGLSVVQSISRFYFEKINLGPFLTTVLVILCVIGFIITVLSTLLSSVFSDFLSGHNIPGHFILIVLLYTLFSQVSEILLLLWRVSYKTVQYGIFRVCKTSLDLGLSLVLVIGLGMDWKGRVFPQLFVAILFGIIAVIILYRKGLLLKDGYSKEYRKEALSFSTPLIFHSLGSSLLGFSDRFFILFMLGLSDVGIYSVGYQVGMVMSLLQNSFNQAWVPYFYQILKKDQIQDKIKIVKITYVYFIFILIVALLFYLTTPFIYRVFIGKEFESGISVVLWILLGYAVLGMYKMMVNYLFYLKKTKIIAFCTVFTVMINLILNYVLITNNGIVGAAQATLISFVILFIVVFVISKRNYKMPWLLKV